MGARLTMTAKAGYLGKVEAKLVLQPVYSITRAASENTDQIITGKFPSL
jgi:hypothetical protein